jgi:aminoglycoside 3-N-acetyltransferase
MDKNAYFLQLKNKIQNLGVKKGSTIIVCSNILKFLILFKKKKINFNLDRLIDLFIEVVGEKGTVVFYSFNWNFFQGKIFNYSESKSFSGTLSNKALERNDFKRSKSPIYSMLVYGRYQKDICNMNHSNCFSLNSPFGFLLKKRAKCLLFDLDYKNSSFPFFHVAEQKTKSYYRFFKYFSGKIIKNKKVKKIKIKMFVKKNNYRITTIYSNSIDTYLKKINALNKSKFHNINISLLDIKKLYEVTVKQLKLENKLFLRKITNI